MKAGPCSLGRESPSLNSSKVWCLWSVLVSRRCNCCLHRQSSCVHIHVCLNSCLLVSWSHLWVRTDSELLAVKTPPYFFIGKWHSSNHGKFFFKPWQVVLNCMSNSDRLAFCFLFTFCLLACLFVCFIEWGWLWTPGPLPPTSPGLGLQVYVQLPALSLFTEHNNVDGGKTVSSEPRFHLEELVSVECFQIWLTFRNQNGSRSFWN